LDNNHLMADHLDDSLNYFYLVRTVLLNVERNSKEYLFRLEGPVNYILGLSAEHLLKSIYIRIHGKPFGKSHDLRKILNKCSDNDFYLDFVFWVNYMVKDYLGYNFKYQHTFRGLPKGVIIDPIDRIGNKRKYGLVSKSPVEPDACLNAIEVQWNRELEIQRPKGEENGTG